MTTTPRGAPQGDPGGGTRVEMHGESRDSSTFTQIGTQINQPPLPAEAFRPWAELAVPPGLANLPARPGLFVGRAGELARLDAALAGPGGVVVQAVHGLGGIGKSTLAAHWAAAHASDYTLTWWITAATPADIDAGLAALAGALQPALSGVLPLRGAAGRGGAVAGRPPGVAADPGQRDRPGGCRAAAGPGTGRPVPDHQPARHRLARHRRARPPGCPGPGRGGRPCSPRSSPRTGRARWTAPRSCARSWASCRWPSSRPAPTSPRPAPPRGSTWTCWPATRPPCTRPPPKAATPPAPSPGSGTSPWTGWLMTRWPGRCCGSWPGTPPRRSPATLLDGLADPPALLRAIGRLAAYSMLTADAGTLAVHRLVQAVTRTPDPGDPHRDPQAIRRRPGPGHPPARRRPPGLAGPGGLAGVADAAPAHRRPGQPRVTRHRHRNHRLPPQPGRTVPRRPGPARPRGRAPPACPRRPAAGPGRRPPRHPDLRGTTSPPPTRRRGTWAGPSPCYEQTLADRGGSWAPTTPTP